MQRVDYFVIDGVQGRYFECPSGMGALSVSACAKNYRLGRDRAGRYARLRCQGCALGALHDAEDRGVSPSGVEGVPLLSGRRICARCHRPSLRIIHDHLCVSCYNRQREAIVGKDRHGRQPKMAAPGAMRVLALTGSGMSIFRVERVASALEAAVVAARKMGARFFGWCPQRGVEGRDAVGAD